MLTPRTAPSSPVTGAAWVHVQLQVTNAYVRMHIVYTYVRVRDYYK